MIIVFACIFLNQMLWLLLRKIWPSQVTKVTLSYCLIHEILTPLLLFNIFGQEALHADDRKIYDWWIDMNFVVANIVAFNDLKFTLGLQIPCYFVASFFQAWAQSILVLNEDPASLNTSSESYPYFAQKVFSCLLIAITILVFQYIQRY